jgi:general stress protein 26
MPSSTTRSEPGEWAKVGNLIRKVRIGLLTTLDQQSQFHTRPIQTLEVEGERRLWFFTDWNSPKTGELCRDVRVSVGYADPASHVYVAVSGTAQLLRDRDKAEALWSVEQLAYYPEGPADERLALLRIDMLHAEYWIAPGRVSYIIAAMTAAATGTPAGIIGENQKIE